MKRGLGWPPHPPQSIDKQIEAPDVTVNIFPPLAKNASSGPPLRVVISCITNLPWTPAPDEANIAKGRYDSPATLLARTAPPELLRIAFRLGRAALGRVERESPLQL